MKIDRAIDILVIEENQADLNLTKELIKESKVKNKLNIISKGDKAIRVIKGIGKKVDKFKPDIILLNLTQNIGKEVLCEIELNKHLRLTPVVLFTESLNEKEIIKNNRIKNSCCISKPLNTMQSEVLTNLLIWSKLRLQ